MNKNKRKINTNLSSDEYFYIAGVLDSGSCFYITKQQRDRRPGRSWDTIIKLSHCDIRIVDHINDILFKNDSSIISVRNQSSKRRPINRISISGPILDTLLPNIISKLHAKKEQAHLMIEFRKTLRKIAFKHTIPDDIESKREELFEKMVSLNSQSFKSKSSPLSPSSLR